MFEALQRLLRGFEGAAERDGRELLDDALARPDDYLYKGLLTVLLRLVFVLYAEDRGLLPTEHPLYAQHLSVLALFEQLQRDKSAWPDSMARRFGAWERLVALFRAVYLGVEHGDLQLPPRRGELFDPHRFSFLEGWGPAGSAPIAHPDARSAVRLPTVDDETVLCVLEKLLVFEGQRLSYRALDVEQIGSVYEGLMGYHVQRASSDSVCVRPHRVWITPDEVLAVPKAQRGRWLKETAGLTGAQAERLAADLASAETPSARLEALAKYAVGARGSDPSTRHARGGQLVLQPGAERRRTSSHYTPRTLSAPIVRRTLEPLLAVMGESPPSEQILSLMVCDPAMGSGAFLVEACRFLADHVVAAWTREGALEAISREHGEPLLHARRLVAQRCLYGVDKNRPAVELAKLSLWLVTLARDLPFTFVDHSLRHGDSLVGLDFEQIRCFHWRPGAQRELFAREIEGALDEAVELRQRIHALAPSKRPADQREKERLLWDAENAMLRVRIIADLVVGAFFAHEKDRDRERERSRRLDLVARWLEGDDSLQDELLEMQRTLRERVPALHWHLEFPEVFYSERPDPLDGMKRNGAAFMDAFVGNPPFAGKNGVIESGGPSYIPWLQALHPGAHGNADLSAHFFRRAATLLGANGAFGLIATNTIAQGDTRSTGLQWLVGHGFVLYDATKSLPWPGDADVLVSVVHAAVGAVSRAAGNPRLDGRTAVALDSRLREGSERGDCVALAANAELSFQGSNVLEMGFTLTPEEREALVQRDPRNAERIFPGLGGEEVNTSPTQSFSRYVINFGQESEEHAARWPDLLAIVREKVKPERDQLRDNADGLKRKRDWWQFGRNTPALCAAIAKLERCLVTSTLTKHSVFSFQPSNRVFSTLFVFPFDRFTQLAVLQSRIHEHWTRLLSSTRGKGTSLRYTTSDCFDTFPFPQADPRVVIAGLEAIGEELYRARAEYMVDEGVGLTVTYNRLKDPGVTEGRVVALRAMHEEMDRAVLRAYGWGELEESVPPYCVATEGERRAVERFEAAVIDRLFALNASRAEEEKIKGRGPPPALPRTPPPRSAGAAAEQCKGDRQRSTWRASDEPY